jgi:dihydroorotate dehydrogenase electron transfer subunit
MAGDYRGVVLENTSIAADICRMRLFLPEIAAAARPGQFVMVAAAKGWDPFLRRPFGISAMDGAQGTVTLHYRAAGRGTRMLAEVRPRERLNVLGPLGQGFIWTSQLRSAALVGGGMGVAPLLALAQAFQSQNIDTRAFVGAGDRKGIVGADLLRQAGCTLFIATEDGSEGYRGLITDVFQEDTQARTVDGVFACGPVPMLRLLARLCRDRRLPCQVSMEARMACGMGVCMGCVIPVRHGDDGVAQERVCRCGPVFDGARVDFGG